MEDNILVTVICRTYNHERYIDECLKSLVSQKTNFKYEIIVHDDASTDGTAEIIKKYEKEYPDLLRCVYQEENQYSKKVDTNITTVFPMARGKYYAPCEGDDFWTDINKLQCQADFMESHEDYAVCGHAAYYANEDSTLCNDEFFRPYEESKTITMEELFTGWKMATNSLMYRADARGKEKIPFKGDCPNGDYALIVYLGTKGKIYYEDKLMSAYRRVSVGSLNWKWRSDPQLYRNVRMRFLAMLNRIDEYTEYKYHEKIQDFYEENEFQMYIDIGEAKEAKKHISRYKRLPQKEKIKLMIKYYFPFLIKIKRKLKKQI